MSKKQTSGKEENQNRSFHELLRLYIDSSELKQMEMAEELGLESPNIITMFKQGKTKVPLERVPALARVLGIDASMLMRKAMEEYCPDLLKACEETLLGSNVSKNELAIINEIRALSGNTDPAISSIEHKIAVGKFVKKLIHKPKTGC